MHWFEGSVGCKKANRLKVNTSVYIPKPFQLRGIQVPTLICSRESSPSQVGGGPGSALQRFNQRGQFIQSHLAARYRSSLNAEC